MNRNEIKLVVGFVLFIFIVVAAFNVFGAEKAAVLTVTEPSKLTKKEEPKTVKPPAMLKITPTKTGSATLHLQCDASNNIFITVTPVK